MRFVWRHCGAITRTALMLGITVPPFLYFATMTSTRPSAADHAALARLVDMMPVGTIRPAHHSVARGRKP